jgi:3-deoxy-D-manno-octulosonate 8-phosphate phosphatase (KDO 8-P phosphatase)
MIPPVGAIKEKLARVELLLLDVDGVLTDGRIAYNDDGLETKQFHVRDGLGIRLLKGEVAVGVVTGRSGAALRHRLRELDVPWLWDGVGDKSSVLPAVRERTGVGAERTAFLGDDLPDIPLLSRVGVSLAVADAAPEVRARVDAVTDRPGGRGAVREVCEALLRARGRWDSAIARFLS